VVIEKIEVLSKIGVNRRFHFESFKRSIFAFRTPNGPGNHSNKSQQPKNQREGLPSLWEK
jgi:hypothetical protein